MTVLFAGPSYAENYQNIPDGVRVPAIVAYRTRSESRTYNRTAVDFSADHVNTNAKIQSNLNSSNTDGSFTTANSNSFLSPYEILPIDQENKYLRKLSYFIMKLYVVCTH